MRPVGLNAYSSSVTERPVLPKPIPLMRSSTRLLTVAFGGLLLLPAAVAQTSFTELAMSDSLLQSRPGDDFYISSAAPADFDGDGDFDLLVEGAFYTFLNEPPWGIDTYELKLIVFRNDGAQDDTTWAFTSINVPLGDFGGGRTDLAWADYDNDGDLDFAYGSGYSEGSYFGDLRLYRNDGGGAFTLTSTVLPRYYEASDYEQVDIRSLTWADYDNDGDLDLLVPSITPEDYPSDDQVTGVLRNDGPGAGDAWTFTLTEPGLDPTKHAASTWADMDGDEDLDLLLADVSSDYSDGRDRFTRTYRNDGGVFTEAGPPLPPVGNGSADWADVDADGDLDVLLSGTFTSGEDPFGHDAVRVYFNEGTHYDSLTVLEAGTFGDIRWTDVIASSWADYDSDGDMDLLAAGGGYDDSNPPYVERFDHALVFANDGAGGFTEVARLPAATDGYGGAFTWFDVDGDGDLDYFMTGAFYSADYVLPFGNQEARAVLYRNDAVGLNQAPSPPPGLSAAPTADGVTLSWGTADDDHTPAAALTYNIHVLSLAGSDIVSPMSRPGDGVRMLPEAGNVSLNTAWTLRNLPEGMYEWRVQAVDNAFNGGPFAEGGVFTVGQPTDAESEATLPSVFAVGAAYPNPVRSGATLRVDLPEAAEVGLVVYDVLGREVVRTAAVMLAAGRGQALALDASRLPSGVYLWQVEAALAGGTQRASGRLTVVR